MLLRTGSRLRGAALGLASAVVLAALATERAAGEQAAGEQAAGEQTAGEQAAGEQAAGETAAGEEAVAEEAAEEPSWEEKPYIQANGAFDYGVYNGYRRYHAQCHVCHGPDALGGSFAPALAESLKTMSYTDFLEVVVNGRESTVGGQQSVMPSFGHVEDVMLYIDHIYAYLKARADGELGRGRPQRLPPEEDPVWQEYQAQSG